MQTRRIKIRKVHIHRVVCTFHLGLANIQCVLSKSGLLWIHQYILSCLSHSLSTIINQRPQPRYLGPLSLLKSLGILYINLFPPTADPDLLLYISTPKLSSPLISRKLQGPDHRPSLGSVSTFHPSSRPKLHWSWGRPKQRTTSWCRCRRGCE